MNLILLSGGSGKRLWPLSNDVRSKQFIKIYPTENGGHESMVQRIYRQIRAVDPEAVVTIATGKAQVSAIHHQLGEDVGISVEPCRRDTFAAIALATAYLHDVKGVGEEEAVAVCPVDPYVEKTYFQCVKKLVDAAERGEKKLVLMGIQPTCPSEKYGYIKPTQNPDGTPGYTFTEKPTKEKAEEYIRAGALWNGGVFAYKLSYVLKKSRELLGTDAYSELFANYANLKKISFDYAVVEAETSIEVIRYDGEWKDIGTWNTLTETMEDSVIGKAVLSTDCSNVHVINELGIPVLGVGLKDLVISASPEGILVSDKEKSDKIKPYVDAIDQPVMFAEKSWGTYRVLDIGEESLTLKLTLLPGRGMSDHSHEKRDEVWTVISGSGWATVDGNSQPVKAGDIIAMKAGSRYTVTAGEDGLQLIEVQHGKEITVSDKVKYNL